MEHRSAPSHRRNQRGQSLAFALLTLFGLCMMAMMVVGVSEATTNQMRMQTAADTAALAGAQVEADCISQIAWINNGLSKLYYKGMSHNVRVAPLAIMAELEEQYDDLRSSPDLNAVPTKEQALGFSGIGGSNGEWAQAWNAARDEVPKIEKWMTHLSKLERTIAYVAADLMDRQIRYTAQSNGAESALCYPQYGGASMRNYWRGQGVKFLNENRRSIDVDIVSLDNGWELSSAAPDFLMTCEQEVGAGLARGRQFTEIPDKAKMMSQVQSSPDTRWKLSYESGGDASTVYINELYGSPETHLPAQLLLTVPGGGQDGSDSNTYVYMGEDKDGNLEFETMTTDGTMKIEQGSDSNGTYYQITKSDGTKFGLRINDEGNYEYRTGTSGTWTEIESDDSRIGGVSFGSAMSMLIPLGENITVDFSEFENFGVMRVFLRIGNNTVEIVLPSSYSGRELLMLHHLPGVGHVRVEGGTEPDDPGYCSINGLSTRNAVIDEDHWMDYHWNDRAKHRLLVEVEDERWQYQMRRRGSIMQVMDRSKLGLHGIMTYDPILESNLSSASGKHWERPDPEDDEAYLTTKEIAEEERLPSRWDNYPAWARPTRDVPAEKHLIDRDFGGFYDMDKSAPRGGDKMLSHTVPCWFCGNAGSYPANRPIPYMASSVVVHQEEEVAPEPEDGEEGEGGEEEPEGEISDETPTIERHSYQQWSLTQRMIERPSGFFLIRLPEPFPVSPNPTDTPGLIRWLEYYNNVARPAYEEVMSRYPLVHADIEIIVPYWLRVQQSGGVITGWSWVENPNYCSTFDGANTWYIHVTCPCHCSPDFSNNLVRETAQWYPETRDPLLVQGNDPSRQIEYNELTVLRETYETYMELYALDPGSPETATAKAEWERISDKIAAMTSHIRRDLQSTCDRTPDITSRPVSWGARVEDRDFAPDDVDNPANQDRRDFFRLHLEEFQDPLELAQDFWAYSVTTMTWKNPDDDRFWFRLGTTRTSTAGNNGAEAMGRVNPYSNERADHWGHFGMATARLFLANQLREDGSIIAPAAAPEVERVTRFPWEEPVEYDLFGYRVNHQRDKWQESAFNLFEPDWAAALIPIGQAIDLNDEYTVEELDDKALAESEAGFLFDKLHNTPWRRSATEGFGSMPEDQRPRAELNSMSAPPWQDHGRRIDWDRRSDREAMGDLFQH